MNRPSVSNRATGCALVAALGLSGCTTIYLGEERAVAKEQRHDLVSVGVTRIVVPKTQGDLVAFKRTGLGLGFGSAVGAAAWLGFDQNEWVIADPSECQLLVVIRSNADAEHAAKVLETLEGEDICYANDTLR